MFTGIVRALGTVTAMESHGDACQLQIDLAELNESVNLGDSIAVNGACLTVSELNNARATFAVSPETMKKCLVGEWSVGMRVNLEPSPTPQTPLGGHLMSGHVDGIGKLTARREIKNSDSHFVEMEWQAARELGRLIAVKGAVAIDGVSLTVNTVTDDNAGTKFTTMIVPHTLTQTTLGELTTGAQVHLEVDSIARYVQRLMETSGDKNVA